MEFIKLSDEVLTLLIDTLPPTELEAFSSTCQHIHHLSSHRLPHHYALKRRYSTVQIHDKVSPPADLGERDYWCAHPFELLQHIDQDPRIALYVRHISYKLCECEWNVTDEPDPSSGTSDPHLSPSLRTAALSTFDTTSLLASTPNSQTYRQSISRSDHLASFILLLSLLPAASHLRIRGITPTTQPLAWSMIHDLSAAQPYPLTALTSIELRNEDAREDFPMEYGDCLEALLAWDCLPSVRALHGFAIDDTTLQPPETQRLWLQHSAQSIERLELYNCPAADFTLDRCVSNMPRLRRLIFAREDDSAPVNVWDARSDVARIVECVGENLEELRLTSWCGTGSAVGSLVGCKKLRKLTTEAAFLVALERDTTVPLGVTMAPYNTDCLDGHEPPDDSPDKSDDPVVIPRLSEILPASLGELHLCNYEETSGHVNQMASTLASDTSRSGTRTLKRFGTFGDNPLSGDAKTALEKVGVEVVHQDGRGSESVILRSWICKKHYETWCWECKS